MMYEKPVRVHTLGLHGVSGLLSFFRALLLTDWKLEGP